MKRPFLTAEWRHLAMVNYTVDPAILRSMTPSGTELDFWNGRTFLSLVAFRFLNTRLMGMPIPFHRNFEEVNLRFYVRRKASDGWRRGVVFIKEFVPRRAVALVARWFYNENYRTCRTSSVVRLPNIANGDFGSVKYMWNTGLSRNSIVAEIEGEPRVPVAESEEEFISEHYWGYTRRRNGGSIEYAVEHSPWRVWRTTAFRVDCDIELCYGEQYCSALTNPPTSAFVAEGSPVAVYRGVAID
jgi:uncharacterized protein